MVYSPSIGDIVLVCQIAKTVHSSFKKAPLEFQAITREIKELSNVLDDVRNQSQKSWSPLRRDSERLDALQECLEQSSTQLQQLSVELEKFNSLGSLAPKPTERVLYITRNFDAPREELRKRRDELHTQLLLANTDAVGQMLKIVHERAEDERAGRREVVINNSEETEDDVFSVVSQELMRHRIAEQDILAHKSDIDAYINDLRNATRNEQELTPFDSMSEVGTTAEVVRAALPFKSQPRSNIKISLACGMPIQQLSKESILDPFYDLRGCERPDAFDVWGLFDRSLSLQRKLTHPADSRTWSNKHLFRDIREQLSILDPFLILLVADSSTNRDFWTRMMLARHEDCLRSSEVSRYGERIEGDLWPFDMQFHEIGTELLSLLGIIESQLTLCKSSGGRFRDELYRKTHRSPHFRPLSKRQRLPTRLTKLLEGSTPHRDSSRSSMIVLRPAITAESVHDSTVDDELCLYSILEKNEITMVDQLKLLIHTLVSALAGIKWTTPEDFADTYRCIRKTWCKRNGLEDDSLLTRWLMTVQGFIYTDADDTHSDGMSRLTKELNFQFLLPNFGRGDKSFYDSYNSDDEEWPERTRLPFGVIRINNSIFDLRFGGQALDGVSYRALKIRDRAHYLFTNDVRQKYVWDSLIKWQQGALRSRLMEDLPEGYEVVFTEDGRPRYVNVYTEEESLERPLATSQSDK